MKLDNHTKTEKRNRGVDTRPGHRGKTLAGSILSLPKMYHKALTVLEANLDQGDLKAAIFAIEQVDGKAKQKIDLSTLGDKISPTNYNVISIEQKKEVEHLHKTADEI